MFSGEKTAIEGEESSRQVLGAEFSELQFSFQSSNGNRRRPIDFRDSDISGSVDCTAALLGSTLRLEGSRIGADVVFRDAVIERDVRLGDAEIEGEVDAQRAEIRGRLGLDGINCEGRCILLQARIRHGVHLRRAKLGGGVWHGLKTEGIIQSVVPTPERLIVHRQRDAHSRLSVHDRDGTHLCDVSLPSYCTVTWLSGNRDAPEAFFGLTGFDRPSAVRGLDLDADSDGEPRLASTELDSVDLSVPNDLVVEQRFVDSTDGAEVPVFVCYREDVAVEGPRPTLLYGYGGFRNSITPSFGRFRLPFLADGGAFAAVCARGGYEYGEPWHEAGMLADKQHTFDDFVAAGEALCGSGLTDAGRLAVAGGSNGGLSVGAVVTQRPDLWAAAQCAVPLLDMLRFHRFLLGESWTTEYGHPEDPEAFEYLRAYSPYHNVEPGAAYPPVYFTTAASDTRVHPSHARKMTARLQSEAAGGPFLLRTKSATGHGVGKPASMIVDEQADSWAFLYEQLGVEVGDSNPDRDDAGE